MALTDYRDYARIDAGDDPNILGLLPAPGNNAGMTIDTTGLIWEYDDTRTAGDKWVTRKKERIQVPNTAFSDIYNPTTSEVQTWVTANLTNRQKKNSLLYAIEQSAIFTNAYTVSNNFFYSPIGVGAENITRFSINGVDHVVNIPISLDGIVITLQTQDLIDFHLNPLLVTLGFIGVIFSSVNDGLNDGYYEFAYQQTTGTKDLAIDLETNTNGLAGNIVTSEYSPTITQTGSDAENPDYVWECANSTITETHRRLNDGVIYIDNKLPLNMTPYSQKGNPNRPFQSYSLAASSITSVKELVYIKASQTDYSFTATKLHNIYAEDGTNVLMLVDQALTNADANLRLNWRFDRIEAVTYDNAIFYLYLTTTEGNLNISINSTNNVIVFGGFKITNIDIKNCRNSGVTILSNSVNSVQNVNIENYYKDGTLSRPIGASDGGLINSKNCQYNYYIKNIYVKNNISNITAPVVGTSNIIDVNKNNVKITIDNIYVADDNNIISTVAPVNGSDVDWFGSNVAINGSTIPFFINQFSVNTRTASKSRGVYDYNYYGDGNGVCIGSSVNVYQHRNGNYAFNLKGRFLKGIPVLTKWSNSNITNTTFVFNLDVECDNAMGVNLGLTGTTAETLNSTNTIVITGKIKVNKAGFPCIRVNKTLCEAKIVLKDLTLINDGVVDIIYSDIVATAIEVANNVKTNSLIVDANTTILNGAILRDANLYKY